MERGLDTLQGALDGEKMGKKIIAKFLDRIAARNKDNKQDWGYTDEHDQEHHDDWTWNDHG